MFFRLLIFLIFLTPIVLGLLIPFLANSQRFTCRIKSASLLRLLVIFQPIFLVTLAIVLFASVLLVFYGKSILNAVGLMVFLIGLGIWIIALIMLGYSLGISGNLIQMLVTLVILLMCGTVFYANPFIELYQNTASIRNVIIAGTINLNPILVIGSNFLNQNLLLEPMLYDFSLIQYYPHYYLPWYDILSGFLGGTVLILVICGILKGVKITSHSGLS